MPKRKSHTPLQRAKIFDAHDGICHICRQKIQVGEKWEIEHVIALEISRDDSDENKAPAHTSCHRKKTRSDAKNIAKAKRVRAKHIGAHKSKNPMPGSRNHPLKKKVGGGVVRRDTGEEI